MGHRFESCRDRHLPMKYRHYHGFVWIVVFLELELLLSFLVKISDFRTAYLDKFGHYDLWLCIKLPDIFPEFGRKLLFREEKFFIRYWLRIYDKIVLIPRKPNSGYNWSSKNSSSFEWSFTTRILNLRKKSYMTNNKIKFYQKTIKILNR